ncbi:MAG: hypothetical protein IKQ47_07595 [Prevotella sp.]|nr:hypothetical protein [Prevotella sp.]
MSESRETILGIIQEIKDATEPNSVTNRMVAAVFDFFASELVTEQTVQQFLNQLNSKQDAIQDLDTIRNGAAAGATALQEHQDISGKADTSTVDALAETVTGKAVSVNIADYLTSGGTGMPKGALYHFGGIPLHSRNMEIDDGDTGGTDGDTTEAVVFCYHSTNATQAHGTAYYAFYPDASTLRYLYQWTYANAPSYIKKAFAEYEDTSSTSVLIFNNPEEIGNLGSTLYNRVVNFISDRQTPIVPLVLRDYSDGLEIVSAENEWYMGYAYRDTANSVRMELLGVSEEVPGDIRAWVRVVKNGMTYTVTHGYHVMMSTTDKTHLDTMYQYGRTKGWWN